jgi:3-hydroxybutyrate dehydrogenase
MGNGTLEGKVAIVTGGSRGIGRAIAEAMLDEGARVAISGTTPEKGEQTLKEIDAGSRAMFVRADARVRADQEQLVAETVDHFGSVDILVNNAGGSSGFALIADLGEDAWQEAADWVLNSAFWATRVALPHMVASNWGRIINISSLEAKTAQTPMASHYTAFKAALNAFSRCVATEYAAAGITSNAICPGAVETDLMLVTGAKSAAAAGISYEAFKDSYAQQALTKKLNTVEEVAAVAILLASPAGAGITGTTINVDGGTSPW